MNNQKIVAEKTLTYIYSQLCSKCREKFSDAIIELGLDTANDLASEMNLPF